MKSNTVKLFAVLFIINIALGAYIISSQYSKLNAYREMLAESNLEGSNTIKNDIRVLGQTINDTNYSSSTSGMTDKVAKVISKYSEGKNGSVSVYFKNLGSGETVIVNGKSEYYMASLYKLIVTLFVLEYEAQGKLHFTDQIGSPPLTIENALTRIITESNNEYAVAIADEYGWETIESVMSSRLGMKFKLDSSLETNVETIGVLLDDISRSIKVNDVSGAYLLSLMNKQQRTTKLPKYLPKNIYSHNKTGEFEQNSHDAGIFYTPKANYILVFMSKTASPGTTDAQMARMSEEIYEILNN